MAFWRVKVSNCGLLLSHLPRRNRTRSRKYAQLCLCPFSNAAWNHKCRNTEWRLQPWNCLQACGIHSSSLPSPISGEVTVVYKDGLPEITVPLPSRRDRCRFTLRPLGSTVGDFMRSICVEDRGVDHVTVTSTDGVRIASTSSIESLLRENFILTLNNQVYLVEPPSIDRLTSEETQTLSDLKMLVARLYESLTVSEHQLEQERKLLDRLHSVKEQLGPLERKKSELMSLSQRRTTLLSWLGLGLMGVQFGILARLTWWEYSWDIMEPVTYFITYGTTMAMYAYFVVTRQDYVLPEVRDRQFLISFYKFARRQGMDVSRYNALRDELYEIEEELRRLRDPLQKHLPVRELGQPCKEEDKQQSS
ncbi:calcium uniporter protein, mitochondrial [Rhipicephalus sanguineus]|uniref:calcium uniporter protein, mitochondrial n=1 Tax=Rhipicephalus sanguineus TaxID=34632 RepID=UPI001894E23C|nr:calcium uniporter protein, mitochondrial [Rhipicephalus sanguineus]